MERQSPIAAQILELVRANPGCCLDELTERLPAFQWSDIFVEVDRLSRSGQLRLTKQNCGFLMKLHALEHRAGGDN